MNKCFKQTTNWNNFKTTLITIYIYPNWAHRRGLIARYSRHISFFIANPFPFTSTPAVKEDIHVNNIFCINLGGGRPPVHPLKAPLYVLSAMFINFNCVKINHQGTFYQSLTSYFHSKALFYGLWPSEFIFVQTKPHAAYPNTYTLHNVPTVHTIDI